MLYIIKNEAKGNTTSSCTTEHKPVADCVEVVVGALINGLDEPIY
jgi:hypothetical protein